MVSNGGLPDCAPHQVHAALELHRGVKVFRLSESAPSMPPTPPPGWVVRVRVISAVGLKATDLGLHGASDDP
jgi:hypothetical protein